MSTTFTDLGVPPALVEVLARQGVITPFPVQTATIAAALAGRDVCGRAPTGSGKTLAFALPIAATVGKGGPRRPRALILVPTRELAAQVAEALRPLAAHRGRTVATFYGGTTLSRDQRCLRNGVDIAVACPGRLADLVRRKDADLRDVDFVVIDEADRMADMGFLPEVKRLLDQTSAKRQTLLYSATLDGDVDVLIKRYQHDPIRYEQPVAAERSGDVRHFFWHAEATDRVRIAGEIVKAAAPAIVFTRTKHGADRVAKQLQRQGVGAVAIHGNRSQGQRERALSAFQSGRVETLVATDVAARGIHVDNVGVVVHFDPPATDKDYVHRSGRTGRAGADGLVVTLVTRDTLRDVKAMQRHLSLPAGVGAAAVEQLVGGTRPAPRQQPTVAPRPAPAAHTTRARRDRRSAKPATRGHGAPAHVGAGARGRRSSG